MNDIEDILDESQKEKIDEIERVLEKRALEAIKDIKSENPGLPEGKIEERALEILHNDENLSERLREISGRAKAQREVEEEKERIKEDCMRGLRGPTDKRVAKTRTCPDCEGSGEYVGLSKVDDCRRCGGSGEV